jgi:hypothetical protein
LKRLGTHCDGRNLNLVVTDKGASWQFRFMLNGRVRTMGLGGAADVMLACAPAWADEPLFAATEEGRSEGLRRSSWSLVRGVGPQAEAAQL